MSVVEETRALLLYFVSLLSSVSRTLRTHRTGTVFRHDGSSRDDDGETPPLFSDTADEGPLPLGSHVGVPGKRVRRRDVLRRRTDDGQKASQERRGGVGWEGRIPSL